MTKHTPGPWKRRKEWSTDDYALEIFPAKIKPGPGQQPGVAMVNDLYDECVANARLIASAPELLQVLEDIMEGGTFHPDYCTCCEPLRKGAQAAIAKAKGEA